MIKFENTEIVGWEAAIRGMRNPMNSWEKSDSGLTCSQNKNNICDIHCTADNYCKPLDKYLIGPNDYDLMMRLRNAGTDHRKFMRMIAVYVDITAPLYWWKEFDAYKVGTVANSCSTMHKIHEKEFTLDDFSHEHLFIDEDDYNLTKRMRVSSCQQLLLGTIAVLNASRNKYLETKDKIYWWQMIQLLPTSYNQKRTVMLNYEVLANIYKSRNNHKLDEWKALCDWIETLPYSELITGGVRETNNP